MKLLGAAGDGMEDYRLRIVVAAFAVGVALQITSALSG